LHFVSVFELFDKQEILKNYIEILHRAMYARTEGEEYLGNWNLLIGNIPLFLEQYEINVNWEKIYRIFNEFLDISLI